MKKKTKKSLVSEFDMKEVDQAAADWQMPEIREPDFSDVRKRILRPSRILLFIIISAAMWIALFWFMGAFRPK